MQLVHIVPGWRSGFLAKGWRFAIPRSQRLSLFERFKLGRFDPQPVNRVVWWEWWFLWVVISVDFGKESKGLAGYSTYLLGGCFDQENQPWSINREFVASESETIKRNPTQNIKKKWVWVKKGYLKTLLVKGKIDQNLWSPRVASFWPIAKWTRNKAKIPQTNHWQSDG